MPNYIETAAVIQSELDQAATASSATGWMEANAGRVKYNGGKEIKIPKMTTDAMADYDRNNGFVEGGVTLSYETREMTQDRGRGFTLDPMDVDESNYSAEISAVMGEFQREHVIPEIDAYRISSIATDVIGAKAAGMIAYDYTPGAAGTDALKKIKEGITAVRESGYSGPLTIQIESKMLMELELVLANQIRYVDVLKNGVVTKVPAIDECPLVPTTSDRMVTAITTLDGTSEGQKQGGWKKADDALSINFMVIPTTAPLAVSKLDNFRIFDPQTYQKANAWHADYRRYHDLWVADNKLKLIYLSIKDKEPTASVEEKQEE